MADYVALVNFIESKYSIEDPNNPKQTIIDYEKIGQVGSDDPDIRLFRKLVNNQPTIDQIKDYLRKYNVSNTKAECNLHMHRGTIKEIFENQGLEVPFVFNYRIRKKDIVFYARTLKDISSALKIETKDINEKAKSWWVDKTCKSSLNVEHYQRIEYLKNLEGL